MKALIKGVVLEFFEKEDKETKKKIPCVRLFQKGEKKLVEVKGTSNENMTIGEEVSLLCKLFPWANDRGQADVACSFFVE